MRPRFIIITHEFAPFRGGAATYAEETANALQRAGAAVEVWAPDYGKIAGAEQVAFPVTRLRADGSLRFLAVAQLAREIRARKTQLQSATVLLASVGAHLAFMQFIRTKQIKCGRLVSVLYGSEMLRFERNRLLRPLARSFYHRVDAIVTISEFSRSLIERSFLAKDWTGKIAIAPCAGTSVAARAVAGTRPDDGKIRILTLARIHPRKGQLDTARALGRLPAELRARIIYQLGGAGDADYLRQIRQACAAGGVAFEAWGEIGPDALAGAYAQCDIFAMTSRALARSVEGFGIVYLDAGFHGKPVVGYRSGGTVEAVLDGETGLLVEEGDLNALAQVFARLISDGDLRARLGTGGRRQAERFNWSAAANVFLNLRFKT